jgi:hypothetical protein
VRSARSLEKKTLSKTYSPCSLELLRVIPELGLAIRAICEIMEEICYLAEAMRL